MAMLLGGRTAEELIFGDPTTGASDDIDRVASIARSMITEYGMSNTLGPQRLGSGGGEVFLGKDQGGQADYSEELAARIDEEATALVEHAHLQARAVLEEHRTVLDELAAHLIEHETLEGEALDAMLERTGTTTNSGVSSADLKHASAVHHLPPDQVDQTNGSD